MLSFVDALKQIIADIQATGGMTIERTSPSSQLLQKLREYTVQCLAEATSAYQLEEWFTMGSFDEHVRVCIVHLHELGLSSDVLGSCCSCSDISLYPSLLGQPVTDCHGLPLSDDVYFTTSLLAFEDRY